MPELTPKLLSDSNSPQLRQLQTLATWKPEDPAPLAKSDLSALIETLTAKLQPAQPREYAKQMARLAEFTAAFGIPCQAPDVVQAIYREQLGKLPADLLESAVNRVRESWTWANRMPFPAEIMALVAGDFAARKSMLSKAQVAALKATDGERKSNIIPKERWDELRAKLRRAEEKVKMPREIQRELSDRDIDARKAEWAKIADDCGV